jgi:hypothetical protein
MTVASMIGGVGISLLSGERTPEQIAEHFNPASHKFMKWQFGDQWVGPGGKIISLIKLVAKIAKNPEYAMENVAKWYRGQTSPILSTLISLISGSNYLGEPTRNNIGSALKTGVLDNALPLFVQGAAYEADSFSNFVLNAGVGFVGFNSMPETTSLKVDRLKDELARGFYGTNWDGLLQLDKGALIQKDLIEFSEPLREAIEKTKTEPLLNPNERTKLWMDYTTEQQQVDDKFKQDITNATNELQTTGNYKLFNQKCSTAQNVRRELYAHIQKRPEFSEIVKYYTEEPTSEEKAKSNPYDLARREYYRVMYADNMYDSFGNYDFESADFKEDLFIFQYGQEVRDYIDEYSARNLLDMPEEYQVMKQDLKKLESYWAISTNIWAKYPQLKQVHIKIKGLEDSGNKIEARRLSMQNPDTIYLRQIIETENKKYKYAHPDIALLLSKYY